jgi:short-subunit dehydrogenase
LLTGRNAEALGSLAAELIRDERRIEVVPADLSSESGPAEVVQAAESFGIDLLINNAGLGRFGPHLDNPAEAEAMTVRVNVESTTRLCREILPGLLERARASGERAGVINMASTVAFAPVPQFAVYAASKAYVVSYTEALQAELAREPIDLLLACPGSVSTAFGDRAGYRGNRIQGASRTRPTTGRLHRPAERGRAQPLYDTARTGRAWCRDWPRGGKEPAGLAPLAEEALPLSTRWGGWLSRPPRAAGSRGRQGVRQARRPAGSFRR